MIRLRNVAILCMHFPCLFGGKGFRRCRHQWIRRRVSFIVTVTTKYPRMREIDPYSQTVEGRLWSSTPSSESIVSLAAVRGEQPSDSEARRKQKSANPAQLGNATVVGSLHSGLPWAAASAAILAAAILHRFRRPAPISTRVAKMEGGRLDARTATTADPLPPPTTDVLVFKQEEKDFDEAFSQSQLTEDTCQETSASTERAPPSHCRGALSDGAGPSVAPVQSETPTASSRRGGDEDEDEAEDARGGPPRERATPELRAKERDGEVVLTTARDLSSVKVEAKRRSASVGGVRANDRALHGSEGVRRSRSLFSKSRGEAPPSPLAGAVKFEPEQQFAPAKGAVVVPRRTTVPKNPSPASSSPSNQSKRNIIPASSPRTKSRLCTSPSSGSKNQDSSKSEPKRRRSFDEETRRPPQAQSKIRTASPSPQGESQTEKRVGLTTEERYRSYTPSKLRRGVSTPQAKFPGKHDKMCTTIPTAVVEREPTRTDGKDLSSQSDGRNKKSAAKQRNLIVGEEGNEYRESRAVDERALSKGVAPGPTPSVQLATVPSSSDGPAGCVVDYVDDLTLDSYSSCSFTTNGGYQRIIGTIQQMNSEREILRAELQATRYQLEETHMDKAVDQDTLRNELEWAHQDREKDELQIVDAELERGKLEAALVDANREIEEMWAQFASFQVEANATISQVEQLQMEKSQLESQVNMMSCEKLEIANSFHVLREKQKECIAWEARMGAVSSDLENLRERSSLDIKLMKESHKQEMDGMKFSLRVMRGRMLASAQGNDGDFSLDLDGKESYALCDNFYDIGDPVVARAIVERQQEKIADLESQLSVADTERKKLHNRIQELRGNIRVFVRVRPFVPSIDDSNSDSSLSSPISLLSGKEKLLITNRSGNEDIEFSFDKVFGPSTGQETVFDEVSDLVQSAIDGYNVCIFSYGQTASGKTHTMLGSGEGQMRGIIPRAVEQILEQVQSRQMQKWEFHIKASFLEIYNENLVDLLKQETDSSSKLVIKKDEYGRTFVDGLSCVDINSKDVLGGMEQLSTLMEEAGCSRSVALTKMNTESSRSHCVFILDILGFDEDSGTIITGSLNLCDLAGSERLKRSKMNVVSPKHLKETQAINKSLSCLGDVFNALVTESQHVPYRNSKLTYLLQDCFSGDGKSLMLVNLSPTAESCNESICSLRFGQRVNKIELGKAVKHVMNRA